MSEPRPLALVHAVLGELFPERRGSVEDGALIGALTQPGRAGALAARSAGRGGGYRRVDAAAYLGAAAGRPEAMVKIIVKGGCASAAELRSQIAYIAREGAVDMYGAAAFGLDHPLSAADLEDTIAAWQEGWTGASRYGETLHMIVSYPIGSAPDTVWAAGRDFAEIAFGSGDYGDSWDYLAALHTDMAHPHVHLIVNRRGFDHGTLLATYKGSLLNVDELRRGIEELTPADYDRDDRDAEAGARSLGHRARDLRLQTRFGARSDRRPAVADDSGTELCRESHGAPRPGL